jgi:YidC/Oxa1 family membrane protein insertase
MDRTSWIGITVCLILFVTLQVVVDKYYPPPIPKPHVATGTAATTPPSAASMTAQPSANPAVPTSPTGTAEVAAPITETFTVLENDAMKVTFTSKGAAITEIDLKQHKAENGGDVILNEQSRSNVLDLSGWQGADTVSFQAQNSADSITYSGALPNGVQWQRTYSFGKEVETDTGITGYLRVLSHQIAHRLGQPETKPLVYTLDVSDTLTNLGATDVTLPSYSLSVGRAEPLYNPITEWSKTRSSAWSNNQYLGSGWLAARFHLTTINDFNPGFIPLIGIKTHDGKDEFSSVTVDPAPLHWIGVENQFFTVLLTPAEDHTIQNGEFFCFNQRDDQGRILPHVDPDIEAAAIFPALSVPAGKAVTLNYSLYTGPKDFNRLDALGADQGELMNYGWFELLIVPMLTVLHFWFLIFKNYGVAIILLTLMIKAITWPLQSIANRSGKRMQALAPKLKELQAKHKEQPEKLQKETFALYRKYNVNPFGGCLPALIQMPVFFSLYYMLQNAVELRGQSFLWVHDLTKPDNVLTLPFMFFGTHPQLHILPIMVTLLTMVMMRMTPQIGDPTQAKVAQFMPIVFLFIFYNFAAALSLYYVINNCVSIVQIYRNLRKPMPEL